ncbi:MAG: ABC transporter ATP-binding protein, partial [Flavobacteriaceae bacterium]|nr:ABC transporter ATP-binding protein [Flavobacteriaceae bacterium]
DYIKNKDPEGLLFYILIMLGLLCLEVICQFLFIFYANYLGQSVIRDIRIKLFKKIMSFKMTYFDNSAVGRLVTRTVSDIEEISNIFGQGLFMMVSDLLKMLVVIVVMLTVSVKLSFLVFLFLPLIFFATRWFQRSMKGAFKEVRAEVANLNAFVQERLSGMAIVKLFAREEHEYDSFMTINKRHRKAWVKTVWYNSIFFPIIELMSSMTIAFVIWFGGINAAETNDSGFIGVLVLFVSTIPMLYRPLRQMADKFNTLQRGMVSARRVFNVFNTEEFIPDNGKLDKEIKGDVTFENVHFSYIEGEEVLKGISFEVNSGETIAIVGATGAGKSTIINLLNRFYEIDSGKILIDRETLDSYQLSSLRKQIAIVLQDVFLFADTIYNNITLKNPNISLEDVEKAAKEIGVHQFISSLPGGYHYNVKERGAMLSSGQRQLIAFLRAYVINPHILVLDEATSSIDSYSEQLIQEATKKITKGRTSIVIAHRLATVKKADKIIVMDKGKIVEQGSHKELLQKEGGYYKSLYEIQFMQEEVA